MRTMNFNALAASVPVNKSASMARTMKGERHDVPIPKGLAHFKAPPPPHGEWKAGHRRPFNYSGRQYGRLTVVRYHGASKSDLPIWLVRCTCGDYELRRQDSLDKSRDPDECCYVCRHTREVKRQGGAANTTAARAGSAAWLDQIAEGVAGGIIGAYVVCPDPKNRVKYNVRSPDGRWVFDPGVWDRWIAEQACTSINAQRGYGDREA